MNEFITTCILDTKNGYFKHFNIHEKSVSLYGCKKEDILNVKVSIHENQTIPDSKVESQDKGVDYWAWIDSDGKNSSMIWHKRFLLNMCFPYGIESAEKAGQGKAYRVNIEQVHLCTFAALMELND